MRIEQAYVCGEEVRQRADGSFERRYATMAELAKRFRVDVALIGRRAKRYDWYRRREEFRTQAGKEPSRIVAKARAYDIADELRIVNKVLEKCERAVDEDRMRVDQVADLDRLLRLRRFLSGEIESRTASVAVGMTLDQLREMFIAATPADSGQNTRALNDVAEPQAVDSDTTALTDDEPTK